MSSNSDYNSCESPLPLKRDSRKGKCLLFINGDPPEIFPHLSDYDLIACTDGAFHYLKSLNFPLEKLGFISGDFDSHVWEEEVLREAEHYGIEIIHTPDQERTDFYKALEIILKRGFINVDVYGGSGGEQDHFLGNLTVAFGFKERLNIRFYDDFSEYYFIPESFELQGVRNKIVSLYPFPSVENLRSKGLRWNLSGIDAEMTGTMLTRNFAEEEDVFIEYNKGNLLIFVARNERSFQI